jgi:hypothetical protein
MALARIITRSEVCSRELAFHLLGRGYSVEVVSPDSVPANKAELELRVETDSSGKLTANVVARDGERSASLDFVRQTKMSNALRAIPQALPNLPVTPEVVYLSGGPISKAMHVVAPPAEAPSKNDVNPTPVEILAGPVVKSAAEREAEQEEVATSAATPSLPPLASEPSRLLAASSMIMQSPITQSAIPQSSVLHISNNISNNSSTSKPDHSPAVGVSEGTPMPPKAISPVTAPAAPPPSVVGPPVPASTPEPVAAATSFPSITSPRSSVTSLSAERLRPKRAIPRYRRFGRVPSLVATVAMTWTGMALLLTLAIGLSLRSNNALKGADKTATPSTGPATVTEEKKQTPAAPSKEAKEIERHSVSPLSTAPAAKPERKSDSVTQLPSLKKVALRENGTHEVLPISTQSRRPQGRGESLIARDTVTYLDSHVKKTATDKLTASQTQRSKVIAQNRVTYVNAAPGAPLPLSSKPAK